MGAWEPGRKRTEQHDILLIRPFKFMLLAELHLHTEITQPHLYTPRWCCGNRLDQENTVGSYTKFFLFTKQLNNVFFFFFTSWLNKLWCETSSWMESGPDEVTEFSLWATGESNLGDFQHDIISFSVNFITFCCGNQKHSLLLGSSHFFSYCYLEHDPLSWAFFLYIINIISGTSVTPNNTELLLIIMFTFMIKISQSPVKINLQQPWNHDILQRVDGFSLRFCWLWIYLLSIIWILPPEVDQNLNKIVPPLRIWDFHTVELFSAKKQRGYKWK